jgi:hypothetical protein
MTYDPPTERPESGAPQPGYGPPQPGYGPPQPGYGPPQPGYGASQPGYGAPQPGYGVPQPEEGPTVQPYQVPPGYAVPGETPIQPYQVPADYATPGGMPVQPYNPYQAPPYAYGYGYGYPQAPQTEGLAIAALVVACAGIVGLCTYGIGGLLGLVGAILGHVARRRIARNGTGGAGLALAGIIVGWILTGLCVLIGGAILLLFLNPHLSS